MKTGKTNSNGKMRKEYDFSCGVRGKYAKSYAKGSNVVVLDPDVAQEFPDSKSVNEALHSFLRKCPKV